MRKALLVLLSGLMILPMIFSGCDNDDPTPLPPKKVGMVVDEVGYDDNGFNEHCRNGLEKAAEDMYLETQYIVGDASDYSLAIDSMVQRGANMIFTVGYLMKDQTQLAAQNNPNTYFVAIDVEYEALEDNLRGVVFSSDQVAFMAGYLAAAWSEISDPASPRVGYVAGMDIPPVNQFITGYTNGVAYYIDRYETEIPVIGHYAGDFGDSLRGAMLADSLLGEGVDVIFGIGGLAGNASLIEAANANKYCIGTDMDMYEIYPEIQEHILTSCLKQVDNAVYNITSQYIEGREFLGGEMYVGNLENDGVGFASYHYFYDLISSDLKREILDIKDLINSDDIDTGWP